MTNRSRAPWRVAEFFAGIGLAGTGLRAAGLEVTWSNDIAKAKHDLFRRLNGKIRGHRYIVGDLGKLSSSDLPYDSDLAWASFPCTDLSIAGTRAGLHKGAASSTFWHFIKALSALGDSRPRLIALENVTAFATSHSGRDIASAIRSLNGLGYSVDILSIDARHFLPQSRPRLFLVGVSGAVLDDGKAGSIRPKWLDPIYADPSLRTHRMGLPELPPLRTTGLAEILEQVGDGDDRWWARERVAVFIESLSRAQRARFDALLAGTSYSYRTAYRRMRDGVPRWEVRSDEVAGCLRTSSGGSSKQAVVEVGHGTCRVRWMTPMEYASLMGAPSASLSGISDHHAYSGFGDAVCAPVVEWLARNYLVPVLESAADDSPQDTWALAG
ncbi:DNA cytosine methyltransferase [Schumannella sp. 10F1B-5-1]|uniref:DNA cytosine methyltransferase n=1 Tax=Schumannella sp. 10F1B-5-1 TaxID=2590780 RepID=UPI001130E412|nr:DNA (cytosine-5-)-methyltransferase [Schumannella sp. 10F1B-5-1]TPW73033.1 DNA (cytosine-5-)-methyltransferase [Schumannella sp. 10F1B-5-1]